MEERDFSHFDRVLSPVILFTRDLDLLYVNDVAARTHPWLTSVGLRLFCTEPSLRAARERVSAGHTVILPMENDLNCELVFQPVRDGLGTVEYAFGFVHSSVLSAQDAVFAADVPLFRQMRREVAEPVLEFLTLLEGEPFRSVDPKFGRVLASARKRLIRAGAFLTRTEVSDVRRDEPFRICDANEVLALCAKCFLPMKFTPAERLYLPVSRDALIRIVTDVLTFLFAYRDGNGSICVSTESRERERELRFVLLRALPSEKREEQGLLGDLSFLHHRLSSVGGRIELDPLSGGHFRLSLIFPQVRLSLSDVTVGDSSGSLSAFSRLLLEFLQDLSASDSSKAES